MGLEEAGWASLARVGRFGAESGVDAVIPAILLSVLDLITVSLCTPPPSSEQVQAV